jgi:hypothetical protein
MVSLWIICHSCAPCSSIHLRLIPTEFHMKKAQLNLPMKKLYAVKVIVSFCRW